MISKQHFNITDFAKKVHFGYFDLKLRKQHKVWASHKVKRSGEFAWIHQKKALKQSCFIMTVSIRPFLSVILYTSGKPTRTWIWFFAN